MSNASSRKPGNRMEQARRFYDEGRLVDAALLYKQIVADDPGNVEALYSWARIAHERGNTQNAVTLLERVFVIAPLHAGALTLRGRIYLSAGRPVLARQSFEKAIEADETHLPAYDGLAWLFIGTAGDPWLAEEVCRKGLAFDPVYTSLRRALGKALNMQGRAGEALALFEEDAVRDPGCAAENLRSIGGIYTDLGDAKRAADYLGRSIKLRPGDAASHHVFSKVHKYTVGDPHIKIMQKLLKKEPAGSYESALLDFALGKAFADIGEYDRAFSHFDAGNRTIRAGYEYDVSTEEKFIEDARAVFRPGFEKNAIKPRKTDFTPIFVLGMPRSGTTLAEQILASHPQAAPGGEALYLNRLLNNHGLTDVKSYGRNLDNIPAGKWRAVRNEYIEKMGRHGPGSPYITDKMPANFLHIGFIRVVFPQARIVHCRRGPLDTCFSIFRQLFGDGMPYAYDLKDIACYYRCYRELTDFWHERLPDFIHVVDYETLVADQEGVTRDLLAFCGLPWEPACLEFHKTKRTVLTASAGQVKRPLYKGAVGAWRRYEKHLGVLQRELGVE